MGDNERSMPLIVACDDLEAQLEAGDRSVRHINDDLTTLDALLVAVLEQTSTLANLRRHMRELRANMQEQRQALREVRRAATVLCAPVLISRQHTIVLEEETRVVEEKAAVPDSVDES